MVAGPESSGASLGRVVDLGSFAVGAYLRGRKIPFSAVVSDAPPSAAWVGKRLAKERGTPFIYYFSDSWGAVSKDTASLPGRALNLAISHVENSILRRSELVIAVTHEMAEIARRAGAATIMEVPNGVDTAALTASNERWYPHGIERPFFLYAGNAGIVHGAEVFIEAAEILWQGGVDFDLVFMGYGVTLHQARRLQERWGEKVVILGHQPIEAVASAFRGCVGALSSLRPIPSYAHARPMKSMAGASCGAPAIYAGEGDFADLVRKEGLGFVSRWSPEGAVESMETALGLAAESGRSRSYRARVQEFAVREFDERVGAVRVARAIGRLVDERL